MVEATPISGPARVISLRSDSRTTDDSGTLQIASFHPDYQFAGTAPDDVANYTNRSPYPMLHLQREESVERAVDAYPDAERIPERNIATMRRLGLHGLLQLVDPGRE